MKRKADGISRSISEVFAYLTYRTASLEEAKKLFLECEQIYTGQTTARPSAARRAQNAEQGCENDEDEEEREEEQLGLLQAHLATHSNTCCQIPARGFRWMEHSKHKLQAQIPKRHVLSDTNAQQNEKIESC